MLISFQVRSGELNQVISLRRIAIRPVRLSGHQPNWWDAGQTIWTHRLQERDFRLTDVHDSVVSGDSRSRSDSSDWPPFVRQQQQAGLRQIRPPQTIKSILPLTGDCRDFCYGVH